MSEPEVVRFACIGCGAMNPAGAEVCVGCGHRFAGPDVVSILRTEPGPVSIPPADEPHLRSDAPRNPGGLASGISRPSPIDVFQAVAYFMVVLFGFARSNLVGILGAPVVSTMLSLMGLGLVVGAIYLIGSASEER